MCVVLMLFMPVVATVAVAVVLPVVKTGFLTVPVAFDLMEARSVWEGGGTTFVLSTAKGGSISALHRIFV